MRRFYFPHSFDSKIITINDPDEIHHIVHVLRLKAGDQMIVFNGQGQEAIVSLQAFSLGSIKASIDKVIDIKDDLKVNVILACAVPKKTKFEFIVEKATELGAGVIIPLKTKRTEVVFKADKAAHKTERFEKIIINAAKQCGRNQLPKIYPMTTLKDCFKLLPENSLKIFPSLHHHPQQIADLLHSNLEVKNIVIFIGPEGDFTPDEVQLALENNCKPVTLGETVLKVETAAISCLSLVKYLYNA